MHCTSLMRALSQEAYRIDGSANISPRTKLRSAPQELLYAVSSMIQASEVHLEVHSAEPIFHGDALAALRKWINGGAEGMHNEQARCPRTGQVLTALCSQAFVGDHVPSDDAPV